MQPLKEDSRVGRLFPMADQFRRRCVDSEIIFDQASQVKNDGSCCEPLIKWNEEDSMSWGWGVYCRKTSCSQTKKEKYRRSTHRSKERVCPGGIFSFAKPILMRKKPGAFYFLIATVEVGLLRRVHLKKASLVRSVDDGPLRKLELKSGIRCLLIWQRKWTIIINVVLWFTKIAYFYENAFSTLNFRTSTVTSAELPASTHHRHVSLANIATAFLSERKSSSRRQPSARRKKRLTISEKKASHQRRQSSYSNGSGSAVGQRLSAEKMENGIATILMVNSGAVGGNNKHRTTLVSQFEYIECTNRCLCAIVRKEILVFDIRCSRTGH